MTNHITDYPDVDRFRQAQTGNEESLAQLMHQHDGLVHHIIRRQDYLQALRPERRRL